MSGHDSTHEYGGPREFVLAEAAREAPSCWLSPAEIEWFTHLPSERRRSDWLGGRWCVKRLVLRLASIESRIGIDRDLAPCEITVLSVNARGRAARPTVFTAGKALPLAVSIAHSDRQIVAAVDSRPLARVGIDVVDGAGRWDAIAATWFTARERAIVARQRDPLDPLRIWSAKEACYKAIVSSKLFEPQAIEVDLRSSVDGEARVTPGAIGGRNSRTARIRWRRTAHGLQALAFSEESPR
jgi:4'-phosphopantetheinyl transferase EntD